jgi:hypothetical protein
MSYLSLLPDNLWTGLPTYLAWAAGVAIGIILVRRGGGKQAVLFLAGSVCLLLVNLGRPFLIALAQYTYQGNPSSTYHTLGTAIALIEGLPVLVFSVAGFVCIAAAFLMVFVKKEAAAGP